MADATGESYELEVCDECEYQWTKGTKPVHRETCSDAADDNFFQNDDYRQDDFTDD